MKKLIALPAFLTLSISLHALPAYDNFASYGSSGSLLGGNIAPSGESWIAYTNETPANLVANSNVYVTNYFTGAGSSDTPAPNLPAGFPGPLVPGNDTRTNSIWTPGYLLANNPLGGIGACLQFASPVSNIAGGKIFVSFFVDVPALTGNGDTYGQGQSEGFGWTAGFLPSSQLPSPTGANQNMRPLVFEKFNARAGSASNPTTWKPGIGYNNNTSGAGLASAAAVSPAAIHFIVLDYEFNGGTGADVERIWVDPAAASFGAAAQPNANTSTSPSNSVSLLDAGGFFFLAYCQNNASLPPSGIIYNSLSIGTNWAYVTGGPQFTSYAPASIAANSGQIVSLASTAVAGAVPISYAWQTNNGVHSGPLVVGGRFNVAIDGALIISGVQQSDSGTYTLQVSTPITTENGVAPSTAQTVLTVNPLPPVFISESMVSSGQFQLNFTGAAASGYRLWTSTDPTRTPVNTTWTLLTSNTFSGGVDVYTDMPATSAAQYYVITVP